MRTRKPRLLVVDRESEPSRALVALLRRQPLHLTWVHDDEAALNALDAVRADALVAPLRAPRIDGLRLLRRARQRFPDACVVLFAESGELEAGLGAMREGAADVQFGAPVPEKLLAVLARGFEHQAIATRLAEALERLDQSFGLPHIAGHSPGMRRVLEQIAQTAASRVPVLVEGGAGAGKRLVAQSIHQCGPRRDGPFVWVACDALAPEEAESELFGQEAAAGLGAPRAGRFERADGGTLFLDDIAALPSGAQAALLRALHDRSFVRLGGHDPVRADVRVIAATERELAGEVAAGRFRADLLQRLGVVRIRVPALTERLEDLPLLAERLLAELNREHGRHVTGLTPGVLERFAAHPWPGNVRELRNTLESMVAFAQGRRPLSVSDLPAQLRTTGPRSGRLEVSVGMTVEEVERRLIAATLRESGSDKRRAAALLGIGLRTLYRKIRDYDLA